jgi:hypothetical protein
MPVTEELYFLHFFTCYCVLKKGKHCTSRAFLKTGRFLLEKFDMWLFICFYHIQRNKYINSSARNRLLIGKLYKCVARKIILK